MMTKEIEAYYLQKREETGIRTLHWRRFNFKSKEEVDKHFESAKSAFEKYFNEEDEDMEQQKCKNSMGMKTFK